MAKELPYFRFTSSEWQNGNISLESYEMKGLFIDICSYYWVQDCSITLAMLEKRFKDAKELIKELLELDIFYYDLQSGFITISFLNEQFDILSESRKRRQGAGSAGGKKRASNAKAMLKQSSSYKDKDKDKDKIKSKRKTPPPPKFESAILFYKNEINTLPLDAGPKLKQEYEYYIKTVTGETDSIKDTKHFLDIPEQLSFVQFCSAKAKEKTLNKAGLFKSKVMVLLNNEKYCSGKKTVYQTIIDYMNKKLTMDTIRIFPHDNTIEQTVLGAIINHSDCIYDVSDLINRDVFFNSDHRAIFDTMLQMMRKNRRIDIISLYNELKSGNKTNDLVNEIYLSELTDKSYSSIHVLQHCQILKEYQLRRSFIVMSKEIQERSYDLTFPIDETIDFTEKISF